MTILGISFADIILLRVEKTAGNSLRAAETWRDYSYKCWPHYLTIFNMNITNKTEKRICPATF